jgi:hypothetical protein
MGEEDELTEEERKILARHSPGGQFPAGMAPKRDGIAPPEELQVPSRVQVKCAAVWVGSTALPVFTFSLIMLLNPFGVQASWPYTTGSLTLNLMANAAKWAIIVLIPCLIAAFVATSKLLDDVRSSASAAFSTHWFEVVDLFEDHEGVSILVLIDPVAHAFEWVPVKFRLRKCSWLFGSDVVVRENVLRLDETARSAAMDRFLNEGNVLEVRFSDGGYNMGRDLCWGTSPVFRFTPETIPDPLDERIEKLGKGE